MRLETAVHACVCAIIIAVLYLGVGRTGGSPWLGWVFWLLIGVHVP